MVDVNITRIEDSVGNISNKQICVETGNDADTGHRMWAGKDGAGNTYKFLGKSKPAYIETLNISDFSAAGLLRTDASGDIYGDVNTLGELNTVLGTTIDESTDPRDPTAHALGGADHTSATLAQLNALISDATLDDASDARDPTAHALGGASHTSSTLAQLNALVSDGTLDKTTDTRVPTAHAGSHETGGADDVNAGKMAGTGNVGDSFLISDEITGNPDLKLEQRVATILASGTTVATDDLGARGRLAVDNDYVFASTDGGNIQKFNRLTKDIMEVSAVTPGQRAIVRTAEEIVYINNTSFEFNPHDMTEYESVTSTGADSTRAAIYRTADGLIYGVKISAPNQYYSMTRGATTYTVANIRELSEISNDARSMALSADGDFIYIADFSDSSTGYVRKFAVTTGVHQYATSGITTGASSYCSANVIGTTVILRTDSATYMFNDTGSALTQIHYSADTLTPGQDILFDNLLYHIGAESGEMTLQAAQLPGLVSQSPAHLDGSNIQSSVFSPPVGESGLGTQSHFDWMRSVLDIVPLKNNRFGVQIESVETSLPGSPVHGKYYLMGDTSSDYPNTVAIYDARGWMIFQPYHGATLRDASGQYTYEYYSDRWIKRVDMLLTATVTGDGLSGSVTDVMTIDLSDSVTPVLEEGEFWDVDIEISGTVVSEASLGYASSGKWFLKAGIQQCDSGSPPYINNSTSAQAAVQIYAPAAAYQAPSIAVVSPGGTSDLRITVGVQTADTYDYKFTARVFGVSRTGAFWLDS